ncbi:MAG: hypothetical protein LBK99_22370 [Opitutaceae bacterium]|jgi:hypothetical protein|nr:hypothetical protein [Opitutaceae bacterium]
MNASKVTKNLVLLSSLLSVAGIVSGHAQAALFTSIDFSSGAASYDNHFVEHTAFPTNSPGAITWSDGKVSETATSGYQSVLFDTSASGGSNGSGGVTGTQANNAYQSDFTVSVVFSFGSVTQSSVGLWAKVNDTGNSGYLGFARALSSTSIRLSLYDNSNPDSSALGSTLQTQDITLAEGLALATTASCRLDYTVSNNANGTDVDFILQLFDVSSATEILLASITGTDTSSPLTRAGQVGFRLSNLVDLHGFSVAAAVPEPATAAAVLGMLAVAVATGVRRMRRTTRQARRECARTRFQRIPRSLPVTERMPT